MLILCVEWGGNFTVGALVDFLGVVNLAVVFLGVVLLGVVGLGVVLAGVGVRLLM